MHKHLLSWKVAHDKQFQPQTTQKYILNSTKVKRATLWSIHCPAAGLHSEVLCKHLYTINYMDKMEAVICTIKASLWFSQRNSTCGDGRICQQVCKTWTRCTPYWGLGSEPSLSLPCAVWHTSRPTDHVPRQNRFAWLNDYANQQPCVIVMTSQASQATICYSHIQYLYGFTSFT